MVAEVVPLAARSGTGVPSIRLRGSRDKSSGKGIFPAIPDASPAAPLYEPLLLSEEARLYSYTIIHPNPKTGLAPFALIYADFPEAVRVFGRLHRLKKSVPMQRIGTAADVARAVLFFAARSSAYITGQLIYVCGDRSLSSPSV